MSAADNDRSAESHEVEARELARVERVMMAMPKLTRDIFIARRFHDLSIAEICRQTGLSHKQVMRHLRRAVEHIHDAFAKREESSGQSGQAVVAHTPDSAAMTELRGRAKQAYERARVHGLAEGDDKPPDAERVAAMDSALMRLSGLERDVFLAMRVDNLTIAEIAGEIGVSSEKAQRIFVRAFCNLERNLANPRRRWWRLWFG